MSLAVPVRVVEEIPSTCSDAANYPRQEVDQEGNTTYYFPSMYAYYKGRLEGWFKVNTLYNEDSYAETGRFNSWRVGSTTKGCEGVFYIALRNKDGLPFADCLDENDKRYFQYELDGVDDEEIWKKIMELESPKMVSMCKMLYPKRKAVVYVKSFLKLQIPSGKQVSDPRTGRIIQKKFNPKTFQDEMGLPMFRFKSGWCFESKNGKDAMIGDSLILAKFNYLTDAEEVTLRELQERAFVEAANEAEVKKRGAPAKVAEPEESEEVLKQRRIEAIAAYKALA